MIRRARVYLSSVKYGRMEQSLDNEGQRVVISLYRHFRNMGCRIPACCTRTIHCSIKLSPYVTKDPWKWPEGVWIDRM